MSARFDVVFIGLSITSSWGNGHATTYRALIQGLHRCGLRVLFLERDQPWYADHRDAQTLPYCDVRLYDGIADLRERFTSVIRSAGAVIVGSFTPEGRAVCDWALEEAGGARAFYDIDTPATLAQLEADACSYLRVDQIPELDLVLSFTGGPILDELEGRYGARRAAALYCSVDVDEYRPHAIVQDVDLGYMGTYSDDRQPGLERLLNTPARRLPGRSFMVVGAQYPKSLAWPPNVRRVDHLAPKQHARFYSRQRFTLNITREHMKSAGYSPSVRLFEAAACGAPIISDHWPGIEEIFRPHEEILIARSPGDVIDCLQGLSDVQRRQLARSARERVADAHSGVHRARELIELLDAARRSTGERREARDAAAG